MGGLDGLGPLSNGGPSSNANGSAVIGGDTTAQMLLNCDHILDAVVCHCERDVRACLLRVNRQLYDLVAPTLYQAVRVDATSLAAFFYVPNGFGQCVSGDQDEDQARGRRSSKAELLATTKIFTLESHNGNDCALAIAGATFMTGLETLRLVATVEENGTFYLCHHAQCELLQTLLPRKVIIRNCNGFTRLPLNLRWSLPESVRTVVIVLPTSPHEYYYPNGEPISNLAKSLCGNFRFARDIKIVFWDGYENFAPHRDELAYRRRRILVDHLVPILQNAACTNHRPWPLVIVYGLEQLDLKAGSTSDIARIYSGIVDPHQLIYHALGRSQHVLVSSPWTDQSVPYRVPAIIWEDLEHYDGYDGAKGDIMETYT